MPRWGEFQVGDRDLIPLESRSLRSSVWLRADARKGNVAMIAAVATGAAEALELGLEPATRLRTISVEAAGNAVAHAYPESHGGPLGLQIAVEETAEESGPRIHVRVHDDGIGLTLPPRAGDPPGLGLPIMSSLSERFTLTSGVGCGTTIDATIVAGADPEGPGRTPPAMAGSSCLLGFGDSSFIQPVLGRALAAKVSEERVDVERLGQSIRVGDAIAEQLEALDPIPSALPRVEISRWPEAQQLRVSVGPLDRAATVRLAAGVEAALSDAVPDLETSIGAGEHGEAAVLVTLPV